MSGYTHCRGCGVALGLFPNCCVDGLCIDAGTTTPDDAADGGCTLKVQEWLATSSRDFSNRDGWWASPEWTIAIDEWLAAGAP